MQEVNSSLGTGNLKFITQLKKHFEDEKQPLQPFALLFIPAHSQERWPLTATAIVNRSMTL